MTIRELQDKIIKLKKETNIDAEESIMEEEKIIKIDKEYANDSNRQNMPIFKGDVFFADLNPVVGFETGGVRPVVVIQNNIGNRYSPTIVAAITSNSNKKMSECLHNWHLKPRR